MNPQSPIEPKDPQKACPFLGLCDDPGTLMSFPSGWNCCHHARPVEPVNPEYQRKFCLTAKHAECALLGLQKMDQLPPGLRLVSHGKGRAWTGRWLWLALLILLLVCGLLLLGGDRLPGLTSGLSSLFKPQNSPLASAPTLRSPDGGSSQTPSSQPTPSAQPAPQVQASVAVPPAAAELAPTPSLVVPTADPALVWLLQPEKDIQIRADPAFVIHSVHSGENVNLYADFYGTTVDAIMRVNADMRVPLWVGDMLIIPVGTADVTGLPAFQPHQVAVGPLTLRALAEQLDVDPAALSRCNGLSPDDLLEAGDWLILPRPPADD